jgi:ferredoxin
MPRIRIDNREVEVEPGATVLDAARKVGIDIPALCYLDGFTPNTSCFACVVKVNGQGRLVPSCATKAQEGMVVESETAEVRAARKMALELLLGDHLGDCVGPCQTACPAHMDIPTMIRQIAAGDVRDALATVKEHIALPAVLGRICPAPCEKACRRGQKDAPVAICLLKRFAADVDLGSESPYLPQRSAASGKQVAIVGAGPAGLAAAYYLLREGHDCVVFDDREQPGGMLRYGVPPERLPRHVLDAEIGVIRSLGAQFRTQTRVGTKPSMRDLQAEFDAVLVAAGEVSEEVASGLGLPWDGRRVEADRETQMTALPGVFVAGSSLAPSRLAVRAVASGRSAALAIGQHLRGEPVSVERRPWSVHMGWLEADEMARFAAAASPSARVTPAGGESVGFDGSEARREAERCLHCDCRGLAYCRLRHYAIEYGADPSRYAQGRRRFEQDDTHPRVIYDPGKCIVCGLCIRAAAAAAEPLGLTFIGRGFDVRVGVPFDESVADALRQAAEECARVCPTGAIALRDGGKE